MPLRLDITQPISLVGGLKANAVIHAPSVQIGATVFPATQIALAEINKPTVVIDDVVQAPTQTAATELHAPQLSIGAVVQVGALSATSAINPATPIIVEEGLVRPPPQNAVATLHAPSIIVSAAVTAPSQSVKATLEPATTSIGAVVQPTTFVAIATLHDPTIGGDVVISPPAFTAISTLHDPTLAGDLFVEVVDPPWNVTNIRLTRQGEKTTFRKEDLPHLIGTVLYDWWNDRYNGKAYDLTGGTLIDVYDGDTVDGDVMFDAIYTIVTRNPGDTITTDIEVINFIRDYEMDCLATDLDEASRVLAALLHVDALGTINPCGVTWTRLGAGSVTLDRLGASHVTWKGCGA